MPPKKPPVYCRLCQERNEGHNKAVAEYYLPKEESGDPTFYGWIPICQNCVNHTMKTKFQFRIIDAAYRKLHGGKFKHDFDKIGIYPGKKGQQWTCSKCGATVYETVPTVTEGCSKE